jgi:hypothetical protein
MTDLTTAGPNAGIRPARSAGTDHGAGRADQIADLTSAR